MLRNAVRAATPEIQLLIDEIIDEERRVLLRERRDVNRQPITRGVRIKSDGDEHAGVTRDISSQGVGLISQSSWQRGTVAKIQIDRLERGPATVLAECRWCDHVSDDWYLSGWNFMNVEVA